MPPLLARSKLTVPGAWRGTALVTAADFEVDSAGVALELAERIRGAGGAFAACTPLEVATIDHRVVKRNLTSSIDTRSTRASLAVPIPCARLLKCRTVRSGTRHIGRCLGTFRCIAARRT